MKKNVLRCSVPLILALVLGTGMAVAGDLAPVVAQSAVAAPVCAVSSPAPAPAVAEAAQAPEVADLFTPAPQPAAICPLIGCVNDQYCRRDRDCTTAPGGVCRLFCATRGCCAYP